MDSSQLQELNQKVDQLLAKFDNLETTMLERATQAGAKAGAKAGRNHGAMYSALVAALVSSAINLTTIKLR